VGAFLEYGNVYDDGSAPNTQAFVIQMIRAGDGIWRIESM